ncbi:MAG: haloacid dehalogenase-like hydrolase [Chroococcales cyanobacterium]
MTTILFWDIDGTLLNCLGAGRLALEKAVCELMEIECDFSTISMAGMTDWGITSNILESLGLTPSPVQIHQLLERYHQHLPNSLAETPGFVLEGVAEILDGLHTEENVMSFLLTGNSEVGARAKLAHYGLDKFFQSGAFSEQSADRNNIARTALKLAETQLGIIDLEKCYVIGDTPHDIRCGQAIGAKTIAIASPHYSVEQLKSYNCSLAWEYFPEPPLFMQHIGLGKDEK